jgi:hypothetical protein
MNSAVSAISAVRSGPFSVESSTNKRMDDIVVGRRKQIAGARSAEV